MSYKRKNWRTPDTERRPGASLRDQSKFVEVSEDKSDKYLRDMDRSLAKECLRVVFGKKVLTIECQVCWKVFKAFRTTVKDARGNELPGIDCHCPKGCQINPKTGDMWSAEGLRPRLRPGTKAREKSVPPDAEQAVPIDLIDERPKQSADLEKRIRVIAGLFESAIRGAFQHAHAEIARITRSSVSGAPCIKPGIDPQALLTEKQAGEFLGVSGPTLGGWRKKGKGPRFVRFDTGDSEDQRKGIRYRRIDLVEWSEQRLHESV